MSKLFEELLNESEVEKSNDPIKGPYELEVDKGQMVKDIKAAIKKGAKINLVKYGPDYIYAYGELEDLQPFEKEGELHKTIYGDEYWNGRRKAAKSEYVDMHGKDEGKYSYGNFIPNGHEMNPDFVTWYNRMDRETQKNWSYWQEEAKKYDIPIELIGGTYGRKKYMPRQNFMIRLADAGSEPAKKYLEKYPVPQVLVGQDEVDTVDERDITMFGIFNDGGNCWSTRGYDTRNWYWSTSEGETAKEFRARLNRQAKRQAENNYREYVDGGVGSWGVKVFKDINDFKAACAKVGLHPNLSDYE